MNAKILAASLVAGFIMVSPPLLADGHDSELDAMRHQLQAFSERLDRLEQSNRDLRQENARLRESSEENAAAVAEVGEQTSAVAEQFNTASGASSWTDRITLKGDFRFRQEGIDEQGNNTRNRTRVRARAAIVADVTNDVQVGLGFASGGDDPVSTNQTLGGGGSTKDMRLDLAYFQWSGLENTSIVGGKFKNFLYKPGKSALLFDGDWNPEGIGLAWADGDYFVNAIGTWLESDSKKGTEFSYGLQAGFKKLLGNNAVLTAGISYYDIGTQGEGSYYGDDDDFFGNSFDPVTNTYLYDYEELELFAELGFELAGRPATVFADYVQNLDAPVFDSGYAVGFKYGSAKAQGTWEFGYAWQDLEADAVLGLLTDSDNAGGGTDTRGHMLKGGYAIATNWNAGVTYFINQRDVNTGARHDYDRLQFDLMFKY
jgi:hypothetical protein